ncbi:MAG: hypothetical protein U9R32_09850 [Bacteroidota bacterium]|nr:hypothetical protein [Bacteroidota bacterium]
MDKNKIKFKLNKSEVKALFDLLTAVNFDLIADPSKRIMIRHILEKVYFKLAKRLARKFDLTSISFNEAECVALYEILNILDDLDIPDYERNVKHNIFNEIHSKIIV